MCVFVAGWWGARSLRYFYFFFNFLCDENDEEYIYEKILNGIKEEKGLRGVTKGERQATKKIVF